MRNFARGKGSRSILKLIRKSDVVELDAFIDLAFDAFSRQSPGLFEKVPVPVLRALWIYLKYYDVISFFFHKTFLDTGVWPRRMERDTFSTFSQFTLTCRS